MRTILVTGGAGFIGSRLCAHLSAGGARVISLDNYFTGDRASHVAGVEYREGHSKDIAALAPETPDLVFHLGEYSRVEKSFDEPATVWDLNKAGTFGVLEYCRERGVKLVYAGSTGVYGQAPGCPPLAISPDSMGFRVALPLLFLSSCFWMATCAVR